MFDFYTQNNRLYDTIVCPICHSRNFQSTITQMNILSPTYYCAPEFLEILGEHEHDENYVVSTFICSRAHEFELKLFKSCHCGWMEK